MPTAYLLNPDGTKSNTSITVLGDATNGYYLKGKERIPVYIDTDTTVTWVNQYAKTSATQILETVDKVFISGAEKSSLQAVLQNGIDKVSLIGDKLAGGQSGLHWDNTFNKLKIGFSSDPQDPVFTFSWHYLATEDTISAQLNPLSARVDVLEGFFNAVADADTIINKWNEVTSFLSGYAEGTDLATLLAQRGTLAGNNTWTGDNNFDTGATTIYNATICILSVTDGIKKPTVLRSTNPSHSTDLLLNLPSEAGTIAITADVPKITVATVAPTTPKAGDIWFDIS